MSPTPLPYSESHSASLPGVPAIAGAFVAPPFTSSSRVAVRARTRLRVFRAAATRPVPIHATRRRWGMYVIAVQRVPQPLAVHVAPQRPACASAGSRAARPSSTIPERSSRSVIRLPMPGMSSSDRSSSGPWHHVGVPDVVAVAVAAPRSLASFAGHLRQLSIWQRKPMEQVIVGGRHTSSDAVLDPAAQAPAGRRGAMAPPKRALLKLGRGTACEMHNQWTCPLRTD